MTLLELVVALAILTVAMAMFAGTIVANREQRSITRENGLAAEAARTVFESMRNAPFRQVVALYDPDPANDPGGPGTAPGASFAVAGLPQMGGAAWSGRVEFPSLTTKAGDWQLREDVTDRALGMPRDLNGDSVIDDHDHAQDYLVLPVRVTIEWQSAGGKRHKILHLMLTDYRK